MFNAKDGFHRHVACSQLYDLARQSRIFKPRCLRLSAEKGELADVDYNF